MQWRQHGAKAGSMSRTRGMPSTATPNYVHDTTQWGAGNLESNMKKKTWR